MTGVSVDLDTPWTFLWEATRRRLHLRHNCIGCVKSQSPSYWNLTRDLFPDIFERRARQSREIGARLVRVDGERIFLDELPPDAGRDEPHDEIECGPVCQMSLNLGDAA